MKKSLYFAISLIIALFFFSCVPDVDEKEKSYDVMNIKYESNGTYNVMDLYRKDDKTKPVVMLIHGGAWIDIALLHSQLNRSEMTKFKDQFLKNGYHVANIDYRLITIDNTSDTKVTYQNMLDDIKSAIQYLKDNSTKYSIDTSKIILYGYSAGAHLSLLYSYSVKDSPIPVKLVVSRAGPTNFRNETFKNTDFGALIDAHVDPTMKPMMLSFIKTLLGLPTSTSETETYNWCKLALITELLGIDNTQLLQSKNPSEILDDLIKKSSITQLDDASPISFVNDTLPQTILLYSTKDERVSYTQADDLKSEFNTQNFTNYQYFELDYSTHALDDNRDSAKINEFNKAVIEAIKSIK